MDSIVGKALKCVLAVLVIKGSAVSMTGVQAVQPMVEERKMPEIILLSHLANGVTA